MLGHLQDWQNRLFPAASDSLPTVPLSTCQSVERAQSLQKARASDICVCFWKVGEVLLEVAVTAKLLSASKKGSGLPGLSWCFLCQPNLTLAGTTRTPPLILGQQNSALPTHCFEPAVSKWVSASWWVRGNNSNWCQACRSSKATAVSRDLMCWECSSGYYSKSSTVSCLAESFGVWGIVTS